MKQEDKDILLKDLSARLSYGVKISIPDLWSQKREVEKLDEIFYGDDGLCRVNSKCQCIEHIKPYLFSLSSITDEQKEKYVSLQQRVIYNSQGLVNLDVMKYTDWCYKHHIDINGLIPMGLANDATGKNIY